MLDNRQENEPQKSSSTDARVMGDSLESLSVPVLVELGQVVGTPGAVQALQDTGVTAEALLRRHQRGDWGDLGRDDKKANDQALVDGSRVLSAYTLPGTRARVWIITEADRSVTTLLLPSEY